MAKGRTKEKGSMILEEYYDNSFVKKACDFIKDDMIQEEQSVYPGIRRPAERNKICSKEYITCQEQYPVAEIMLQAETMMNEHSGSALNHLKGIAQPELNTQTTLAYVEADDINILYNTLTKAKNTEKTVFDDIHKNRNTYICISKAI